ncbi:hypothetical protein GF327_10385 [Candidatus Woesearchaeota archaeon]|nr:hypothetical protein [Candidatus Woesearchaeota archaeon]
MTPETTALIIFALTYLLFISEMVNKTVAALLGAMLMVVYGIIDYDIVGTVIDYKTLTVAVGMMIIVNVVKKSGLFEYIAIKAAKMTKGDPFRLMIIIVILSVFISTFFSNITATIVLGTLIVSLCRRLDLEFVPYLFVISLSVNVGGILTPVSSLPNIMISTAAGFSFTDFFRNILVLGILLIFSTIVYFKFIFRKQFNKEITEEEKAKLLNFDETREIKDKKLFTRSIIILILILVFFLIQDFTGIGNEAIAITGAIVMLLLSSADPEEIFSQVQWSTIAFFVGLFIVIGGVEHVGLLETAAHIITRFISGKNSAIFTILGTSTIASSIVDNIPVTAILIPILKNMQGLMDLSNSLFFPLVVGAGLGGNLTPIGSPSNVIAMGIAKKNNRKIKFMDFVKVGFGLTIIQLVISGVYFYLFL